MTYRVSHYTDRGNRLVFDQEYTAKLTAIAAFHRVAGPHIRDADHCVILDRNGVVMIAKHTNEVGAHIHPAFYSEEAQRPSAPMHQAITTALRTVKAEGDAKRAWLRAQGREEN